MEELARGPRGAGEAGDQGRDQMKTAFLEGVRDQP